MVQEVTRIFSDFPGDFVRNQILYIETYETYDRINVRKESRDLSSSARSLAAQHFAPRFAGRGTTHGRLKEREKHRQKGECLS